MRVWLAVIVAKLCVFASRVLKRGGGSSLPGALARRIEPRILARLLDDAALTSIVITGSNGKTTTARVVARILEHSGLRIVWNRSGANMVSGIIAAVIEKCDILGRLSADAAVFEVDEANLRHVMAAIRPKVVLVTNCFRDQLDRYGEVDTTLELIRIALKDIPGDSTLLLNADDPLVASLATGSRCRTLFYGVEDTIPDMKAGHARNADAEGLPGYRPQDARSCPKCGAYYEYSQVIYSHLGRYSCPRCGLSRPLPDFRAVDIVSQGAHGFTFSVELQHGHENDVVAVSLGLPGLYNVYNCLAAIACCVVLDIPRRTIEEGITGLSSAFGRMETIDVGGKTILLALVKNPVGLSEVVRTICSGGLDKTLIICLNDNFADGRDISWIWDADMEQLSRDRSLIRVVVASGTRAGDMAIRLKYAGIEQGRIEVEPDLEKALDLGLGKLAPGETLYVLPTYTAMLEIREYIRHRGHAREFWRA